MQRPLVDHGGDDNLEGSVSPRSTLAPMARKRLVAGHGVDNLGGGMLNIGPVQFFVVRRICRTARR